jgi:hypothetical protein
MNEKPARESKAKRLKQGIGRSLSGGPPDRRIDSEQLHSCGDYDEAAKAQTALQNPSI